MAVTTAKKHGGVIVTEGILVDDSPVAKRNAHNFVVIGYNDSDAEVVRKTFYSKDEASAKYRGYRIVHDTEKWTMDPSEGGYGVTRREVKSV